MSFLTIGHWNQCLKMVTDFGFARSADILIFWFIYVGKHQEMPHFFSQLPAFHLSWVKRRSQFISEKMIINLVFANVNRYFNISIPLHWPRSRNVSIFLLQSLPAFYLERVKPISWFISTTTTHQDDREIRLYNYHCNNAIKKMLAIFIRDWQCSGRAGVHVMLCTYA